MWADDKYWLPRVLSGERIEGWFSFDDNNQVLDWEIKNVEQAERFLLKDKIIGPLVKKYGPCTIVPGKKKDYFIDLVDSITSQQLSGKAAKTIFERVKEKCGGKITPEKLRDLKTEELRNCGLSYAKCSYVKDLAEKVLTKKLS